MDQLKSKLEAATERAHSLKTKKAQTKAWNVVREIRHEILMLLYAARDTYAPYSMQGTVRWFHAGDDHVCIRLSDNSSTYANPMSDAVSKSWYGHTCCVEYTAGQAVVVEFEVDVDSDRLCLVRIPKRIYGGTLNEAQFAELDKRTDLAFFKHSSGGMTGLFASKAGA
jgi:hypothetical protein